MVFGEMNGEECDEMRELGCVEKETYGGDFDLS